MRLYVNWAVEAIQDGMMEDSIAAETTVPCLKIREMPLTNVTNVSGKRVSQSPGIAWHCQAFLSDGEGVPVCTQKNLRTSYLCNFSLPSRSESKQHFLKLVNFESRLHIRLEVVEAKMSSTEGDFSEIDKREAESDGQEQVVSFISPARKILSHKFPGHFWSLRAQAI